MSSWVCPITAYLGSGIVIIGVAVASGVAVAVGGGKRGESVAPEWASQRNITSPVVLLCMLYNSSLTSNVNLYPGVIT